ncbi:MAG: hypothetical protein NZ929_01060 [Aigarchaeota archaeon]|nr:hypothetical protein [Aigarchaeota archaeon]MCX8192245.1 hypothetical protein [Nitrososphaeria archaeon]MDW7986147.1 hypothetical protein [Nitrososphaerota archaeon]
MYEVKILSWDQAKSLAEKEIEERLGGKIKSSWVESIWLTPHSEGSRWIVKLKVVMSKGFMRGESYTVSVVLNSLTGEVEEFEAR